MDFMRRQTTHVLFGIFKCQLMHQPTPICQTNPKTTSKKKVQEFVFKFYNSGWSVTTSGNHGQFFLGITYQVIFFLAPHSRLGTALKNLLIFPALASASPHIQQRWRSDDSWNIKKKGKKRAKLIEKETNHPPQEGPRGVLYLDGQGK